jgi:1,4-alpha-glucan branching enzyme
LIVSPYDAELFGHWWYEGPDWLNFLFRKAYYDQQTVKLTTPAEYLDWYPRNQIVTPSLSSWGYKGYAEVWLEGSNDWIYRHLHKAADRMVELANAYPRADGVLTRALNQAARELLLAQSSDWAFIMKTGTCVPYAVKRTKDHVERFTRLYEMIRSNAISESYLGQIEWKDNLFPDLDYRVYA